MKLVIALGVLALGGIGAIAYSDHQKHIHNMKMLADMGEGTEPLDSPNDTEEETAIIPEELRGNWYTVGTGFIEPKMDYDCALKIATGNQLRYQVTMRSFNTFIPQSEQGFHPAEDSAKFLVIRRNGKLIRAIKTARLGPDSSIERKTEYVYTEPNLVTEWRLKDDGTHMDTWSTKYVLR